LAAKRSSWNRWPNRGTGGPPGGQRPMGWRPRRAGRRPRREGNDAAGECAARGRRGGGWERPPGCQPWAWDSALALAHAAGITIRSRKVLSPAPPAKRSLMFKLSAFADEIDPDPQKQIDVLRQCGLRHLELRSILRTNVLDLTDLQVQELKSLLDKNGITLSALGSPIGKVRIDEPFAPHLQRFRRALELCKVFGRPTLRVFSYYGGDGANWADWRGEVMGRMGEKAGFAEKAGVRLLHENEHRIYGDSPERVKDLLETVKSPALAAVYDP